MNRLTIGVLAFLCGGIAGRVVSLPSSIPFAGEPVVMAQSPKPVTVTRLYTGPDKQTHSEELQLNFSDNALKLLPVSGAELHVSAAGSTVDWHNAPHRQYVITLRGQGEIEVAGGKKIISGPGHIELVEDLAGKGHVTRVTSKEDRLMLWLPLVDQTPR